MKLLEKMQEFIIGWKFPIIIIGMLFFFSLQLLIILLIPDSGGAASAFARDFKVWCFGYDPATGELEMGYVLMYLVQPLIMCGVVGLVWARPLTELWRERPARMLPYLSWALALVLTVGFGLTVMFGTEAGAADENYAFPAVSLRTANIPAPFTLINQDSATVSLTDVQGRVTVITAVYASCGFTCPMILAQTRRTLTALTPAELANVTFLAITLDPERDSVATLRMMAEAQQVKAPGFNFLTGEPAVVNSVLDAYGFARMRNTETGVIDHANLFIVIDRQGKIAYRFALGEQQEAWLIEAIRLLIKEDASS